MKIWLRRAYATLALLFSIGAAAGEQPYDKAVFEMSLAKGKPVIVEFSADWCPTCKAQKPIVQELMRDVKMKEVTLFVADFDKEKELKKSLRVSQQSTFVVFKGGKEVARSTGQTRKANLEAVFVKSL